MSSVNSRGASVWSTITPIVSLARETIGTATIDWKRSSSRSGTYFIRGSAIALSRMNSGCRWRATHPVEPLVEPHLHDADRCGVHRARRRGS